MQGKVPHLFAGASPRDGSLIAAGVGDAVGLELFDAGEEVAHGFVDGRLFGLVAVDG